MKDIKTVPIRTALKTANKYYDNNDYTKAISYYEVILKTIENEECLFNGSLSELKELKKYEQYCLSQLSLSYYALGDKEKGKYYLDEFFATRPPLMAVIM